LPQVRGVAQVAHPRPQTLHVRLGPACALLALEFRLPSGQRLRLALDLGLDRPLAGVPVSPPYPRFRTGSLQA